mgnify:CR=1 FL=1
MAKILVADDERDIRELIGFTLRFAGFDVVLTADGIEAIEKASKQLQDAIERLQKAQDNPTKDDVSKAIEQLQEARRALEAAR